MPLECLLKTIVGRHFSNKYVKRNYMIHVMCMIHIIQQQHKLIHSWMLFLDMIIQLHTKYWNFIFLCIRLVDLLYIMLGMLSDITAVLFWWSLGFVPWIMQEIFYNYLQLVKQIASTIANIFFLSVCIWCWSFIKGKEKILVNANKNKYKQMPKHFYIVQLKASIFLCNKNNSN